ncbi:cysteine--tRNA ligase [Candidatus Jorgensenbacteria bacterium RIFCSPLOWO2_02_FULL_45_12]|nr:MAG: cysteine--tRNA ligase [Candidatus Jorgensenbacteria bacterium RIFCSPLOWO2_02_FULL_45_12]
MMFLFNSLTGKKEKLDKPRGGKPLCMFVCGITAYDFSHLGHARTYIAFDNIVKFLRSRGYGVIYLQNVTDVDDKIIKRALENRISPLALAKKYEKEYVRDMGALGVDSVDILARASEFILAITEQIQTLLAKGFAYKIENDGYYFDISKFKEYGKLSRRTVEAANDAVSRVDESERKKNKGDFCLWKFVSVQKNTVKKFVIINGEPAWKTALGYGRPGWHIEDTAITESFFGPQYDIHGGAVDLKFPHHEAEIAQQEAASGKSPLARFWLHTGFLLVNGEKMSKSLGNFITVRDFFGKHKNFEPKNLLRLLIASHHYRSPVDFSENSVEQTKQTLAGINDFARKLAFAADNSTNPTMRQNQTVRRALKKAEQEFISALEDDFNTPEALGVLFQAMSAISPVVFSMPKNDADSALEFLRRTLGLLGIAPEISKIPKKMELLAQKRELYRRNKQFTHADDLRNRLRKLGYDIEDTPLGPIVRKF